MVFQPSPDIKLPVVLSINLIERSGLMSNGSSIEFENNSLPMERRKPAFYSEQERENVVYAKRERKETIMKEQPKSKEKTSPQNPTIQRVSDPTCCPVRQLTSKT